jgi:hypothetical protein
MRTIVNRECGYARNASESTTPEAWRHLLGWWNVAMNARGGATLYDLGNRRAHGTLTSMSPASDYIRSERFFALDFNFVSGASVQHVLLPNSASINGLANASLSMWIFLGSAPSTQAALYYESTTTTGFTRFGLFQSTSNQLVFVARDSATGSSFAITASATAGVWLHVVGTYNADTNNMLLYINGVLAGTNTTAKGVLHAGTPINRPAIGAFIQNDTALQYSCSAFIADVRTHTIELTQSQVYKAFCGGPMFGLEPRRAKRTGFTQPTSNRRRRILTGLV